MNTFYEAKTEEQIIEWMMTMYPAESLRPDPTVNFGTWAAWMRQLMKLKAEAISVHNFMQCIYLPIISRLHDVSQIDDALVWRQFDQMLLSLDQHPEYRAYGLPMAVESERLRVKRGFTTWGNSYILYLFQPGLSLQDDTHGLIPALESLLSAEEKAVLDRDYQGVRLSPPLDITYQWVQADETRYRRQVSRDWKEVTNVSRRPFPAKSVPPPQRPLESVKLDTAADDDLSAWFPRCPKCGKPAETNATTATLCKKCIEQEQAAPKRQLSLWG